ncbi:aspartyl/asparaginyl beta-hydroxylase domain-containing protein [Chitinimonas koreensis]|uniref:aspartyl/asparaginyl beta-hydroxylase domain-containing protein n=1 Tax=Chitinimonas koreensis TaxID=356302 RepID=UPI00041023EE|nr:aspartyl/asparaginyl beta-hydroxylase domain-containing protein [Chitinimonas koreensis]QNM98720.1 aspartyl/asparaginyl beta-hydroxylase domain-containing protein [Chitinimonas koreensis]
MPVKLPPALHWLRKNIALYNAAYLFIPFFDLFCGGKRRPVFFDIDRTCPELRTLDRHFEVIQRELDALLPSQDQLPLYHELDTDLIHASGRINRDKRWNVFMLFSYGARPEHNRRLAPRTTALLDQIPNLAQAFFSILDPGKSIPAHSAPTRSYIRYHLALRVPERNPPSIRVHETVYTWKTGESVMFDDSWNHEVINRSDGIRAVLLVDVLRPLPWPANWVNRLFYRLGCLWYGPRVVKAAANFPVHL